MFLFLTLVTQIVPFSHNTNVTDDRRQTDTTSYHKRDRTTQYGRLKIAKTAEIYRLLRRCKRGISTKHSAGASLVIPDWQAWLTTAGLLPLLINIHREGVSASDEASLGMLCVVVQQSAVNRAFSSVRRPLT